MSYELADTVGEALLDAECAHNSVGALVELLEGCPPEHQLTAGRVLGLVCLVKAQVDNLVTGLRAANTAMH